jgi:hypothetical protein
MKVGRWLDALPVERTDSAEGAIEPNLLEPETPRRLEFLRFLSGLGGATRGDGE